MDTVMRTVISKDGTRIAYDQLGSGPAVILISAAMSERAETAQLASLLAEHFTVLNYDRRGRGDSGDTLPYAVEREIEDLEALIDAAGGAAHLFGSSSGAVLAMEAAARLPGKVQKQALFEPPFVVDDTRPPVPQGWGAKAAELVAAGRRSEAVEYFMTDIVGVPAEFVAGMKADPMWAAMEAMAHTLAYDGAVVGDTQNGKPLPADRWAGTVAPALVIAGGESEEWMKNTAQAVADILPSGEACILDGVDHSSAVMAPETLVPTLVKFFQAG